MSLTDGWGRRVDYLRLSVIDRCNLRCRYCMAETPEFLPRSAVLSLEELARLARLFIGLGTRRIRLTGGEPLVRRGILDLVAELGKDVAAGRLDELTLTTNGVLLARMAAALAAAGMRRVNVSLDSLDAATFAHLTRGGQLEQVLDGIAGARAHGLAVKINTVVHGATDAADIDRLIHWCGRQGHDLTLIEAMPMGGTVDGGAGLAPLLAHLHRRWTLAPCAHRTGGPARYLTIGETGRRLGLITPMSHGFCGDCNRLRLGCTGRLLLCLGHEDGIDLRAPLRDGADDDALAALVAGALRAKSAGHDFVNPAIQAAAPRRPMHGIGG